MTWGPDDWGWWIRDEPRERSSAQAPPAILRRILVRIAARRAKTLAYLGAPDSARLDFLATHFERTVTLDGTGLAKLAPAAPVGPTERFDVVLAVGALAHADPSALDRALRRVRCRLVEGGLLLATFPAKPRDGVGHEIRLRGARVDPRAVALHEFELQYRLRCAGLRGVRIRRIEGDGDGAIETPDETLLCLAVRRANN